MSDNDESKLVSIRGGTKETEETVEDKMDNLAIKVVLNHLKMLNPDIREHLSPADCSFLRNRIREVLIYLHNNPGEYDKADDLLVFETWPIFQDED